METSAEKGDRMLLLFGGMISLILGILLFTRTGATLSVVMLLVGLSWFIWGIFSLLSIFIDKGEWGWRLFGGVIGIAAGWLVLSNPVASTVAVPAVLAVVLGVFGVLVGIAALISAFQGEGWGVGIFGAISIVIGLLMMFNSVVSAGVLLILVAILLVVQGGIGIVMSFIKPLEGRPDRKTMACGGWRSVHLPQPEQISPEEDRPMAEIVGVIAQISALVFILTSMLAMGLSLTVKQILDPLRDVKVVLLALLANFVLVPALAYLITVVIPLDDGLATGLIIAGAAAGAPFLPKLVQVAKGNAAFSVGLMTLLMVITVIYLPIMLPILLPGASVSPWDIAKSLILSMLLPLGIGLFIKARYEDTAASLQPHMAQASSLAIVLMLVTILVLQFSTIIGTIGTGGILAALIFLVGALVIGLLLGGKDAGMRSVVGLGTAQRNLAAAMLVAAQNFSKDPNVLVMVMLIGILGLVLLMVVGGEMGKRVQPQGGTEPAQAPDDQPAAV